MDSVAAQFHFWTSDVSEITDAEWVEAALNGDRDSARYILLQVCLRLRHRAKHPVIQLLGGLAFGEIPLQELQKQELVKDVLRPMVPENFLRDNRTELGDDFFHYIETCFKRTIKEYVRPRRTH